MNIEEKVKTYNDPLELFKETFPIGSFAIFLGKTWWVTENSGMTIHTGTFQENEVPFLKLERINGQGCHESISVCKNFDALVSKESDLPCK